MESIVCQQKITRVTGLGPSEICWRPAAAMHSGAIGSSEQKEVKGRADPNYKLWYERQQKLLSKLEIVGDMMSFANCFLQHENKLVHA